MTFLFYGICAALVVWFGFAIRYSAWYYRHHQDV